MYSLLGVGNGIYQGVYRLVPVESSSAGRDRSPDQVFGIAFHLYRKTAVGVDEFVEKGEVFAVGGAAVEIPDSRVPMDHINVRITPLLHPAEHSPKREFREPAVFAGRKHRDIGAEKFFDSSFVSETDGIAYEHDIFHTNSHII